MTNTTIRVIIADDHPVIVDGVRTQLDTGLHIQVVGVAGSFRELLSLLKMIAADVVILDLTGMQAGPLTMVERLRRDYPLLKIVVFSSVIHLASELMTAGAHGYIAKEEQAHHLLIALQTVAQGGTYLAPTVLEYVTQAHSVAHLADLSPRELSVLKLLAQHMRTEEIAADLGMDPRTVQNNITALRRKTGCVQRIDLVIWYQQRFASGS